MFSTPCELVKHFRTVMNDLKIPQFWSDPELYAYMSEGELEIARVTLCLPAISETNVGEAVASPTIDQGLIRVRGAWWIQDGQQYPLYIHSLDDFISNSHVDLEKSGRPNTAITGTGVNSIRLYPVPNSSGRLRLAIYRAPAKALDADAKFEIPLQYRNALLDWMQYRACMKDDAEVFDRARAEGFLRSFLSKVDGYEKTEHLRRGHPQSGGIAYGGL